MFEKYPSAFFCLTLRQLNYWQTFLVDLLNKGCPVKIKTNRLCSNNHDFNFIQCHWGEIKTKGVKVRWAIPSPLIVQLSF